MSLYGVQRASSKTDRQVIDKECFEDVLGNTRGQLVNLQSKACHSQDTASWNTFLWVEFIRECCPNSDSDSPVPEIFWNKNRQSASEANPVKVSDDAILPMLGWTSTTDTATIHTGKPISSSDKHLLPLNITSTFFYLIMDYQSASASPNISSASQCHRCRFTSWQQQYLCSSKTYFVLNKHSPTTCVFSLFTFLMLQFTCNTLKNMEPVILIHWRLCLL